MTNKQTNKQTNKKQQNYRSDKYEMPCYTEFYQMFHYFHTLQCQCPLYVYKATLTDSITIMIRNLGPGIQNFNNGKHAAK